MPRDGTDGECFKFGEYPPFGEPTPPRLLRLFGKNSKVFLKGRTCENQGLGIGAFGYYRRVVESHKDQLLDEIIKVAQKQNLPPETVGVFEVAKVENQFLKAIESVEDALPRSLFIDNQHNPLKFLHAALSKGLHAKTDEECLTVAQDIRIVLAALVERIGQILKEDAELKAALGRLGSS